MASLRTHLVLFFALLSHNAIAQDADLSEGTNASDEAVKSPEKAPETKSRFSRFFRIQHAEEQSFLMEIAEGLKVGEPVLFSNRFNLGLYFGKNLVTGYMDFLYGSTTLLSEHVGSDNVKTEVTANHRGVGYGMRFHREVFPFFFPYVGIAKTALFGEISEEIKVRDDNDSASVPLESHKLNRIDITSLTLGADFRMHFWKVLTVGSGLGIEVPIDVSDVKYRGRSEDVSPLFQKAASRLEKKLKQPLAYASLQFGLAF